MLPCAFSLTAFPCKQVLLRCDFAYDDICHWNLSREEYRRSKGRQSAAMRPFLYKYIYMYIYSFAALPRCKSTSLRSHLHSIVIMLELWPRNQARVKVLLVHCLHVLTFVTVRLIEFLPPLTLTLNGLHRTVFFEPKDTNQISFIEFCALYFRRDSTQARRLITDS